MRPTLSLRPLPENPQQPEPSPAERLERIAGSVRQILLDLGLPVSDPHLAETHRRVAKMYLDVTAGLRDEPPRLTTFPNDADSTAMVVERDLPFFSMCSHHLLPFFGSAHVGYVPGAKLLGLSKFARVLEHFARRPQVQERLTEQVAAMLDDALEPRGLIVALQARHLCMEMRGAETHGSVTVTTEARGILRWPEMQARFFHSIALGGPSVGASTVPTGVAREDPPRARLADTAGAASGERELENRPVARLRAGSHRLPAGSLDLSDRGRNR
jgi:GTP cyclohydrolase I